MWRSSSYRCSALALVALLGVGQLSAGCATSNCDTDPANNPAAEFRGGTLYEDRKVYETSAPDGLHLNFGAGARYRIHHRLGGRPAVIQLWVSFSSVGVKDGTGNEALPSGNMAVIMEVNEEFVEVRNDTCGDYWLRVVLAAPVINGIDLSQEGTGGGGG